MAEHLTTQTLTNLWEATETYRETKSAQENAKLHLEGIIYSLFTSGTTVRELAALTGLHAKTIRASIVHQTPESRWVQDELPHQRTTLDVSREKLTSISTQILNADARRTPEDRGRVISTGRRATTQTITPTVLGVKITSRLTYT